VGSSFLLSLVRPILCLGPSDSKRVGPAPWASARRGGWRGGQDCAAWRVGSLSGWSPRRPSRPVHDDDATEPAGWAERESLGALVEHIAQAFIAGHRDPRVYAAPDVRETLEQLARKSTRPSTEAVRRRLSAERLP
jgi:hypothetical protein